MQQLVWFLIMSHLPCEISSCHRHFFSQQNSKKTNVWILGQDKMPEAEILLVSVIQILMHNSFDTDGKIAVSFFHNSVLVKQLM